MSSRLFTRAVPAALAALAVVVGPALVATPALAAEAPAIVVNEVETAADWIELTNAGDAPVDISGFVVKDNDDTHAAVVPAGTVLAAGGFYTVDTNVGEAGFGLGRADTARVYAADGTSLLDTYSWTEHPAPSYGRCPDGTGEFVTTIAASKNAPNVCTIAASDVVRINEIESSNGTPGDWVELVNTATVPVDAAGLRVLDNDDTHVFTVASGTMIDAGGYLVIDEAQLGFGLGGADSVRLTDAGGGAVDAYSWTSHAATTYGRCPDGVGAFAVTESSTKGAANVCSPPAEAGSIVINEVESNGDDTDWVELVNIGAEPVDLSGYRFRDNDATRVPYVLPAGSVVAPGAFFVIDQATGSNPVGFDFGLGNADEVRLSLPDGVTLVAEYAWTVHAAVTYGRCPDGTAEFATTTVSTKGAPNNCGLPIVINEIESQPASGEDWVELVNIGSTTVDLGGLVVRDDNDSRGYVIPAGTTLAAGEYLLIDTLGFGLGGADTVRLFAADGATLIDAYAWTEHATYTYGRCPDPKGAFAQTLGATPGTQNLCEGVVFSEPWPGSPDVRVLDAEATFSGDLSGLEYEPSGSAAFGTLWAVQNGDGLLYKLAADDDGGWAPVTRDGWGAGKTLRYPDGTGIVDAEGVTVVGGDSSGGVYVSTERNNAAGSISRPSVLRYDVTAAGAEIAASHEWNLAADFPGLPANGGLEGITWVPDTFLVDGGFVDETTGLAYRPADYPGHGDGLFFIGVEGTASVYAYALMEDGGFERIATSPTTFALVADVTFDADLGALWVVCDESCDGRIALYEIDESGAFSASRVFERPVGMANIANEGFAVADDAVCADGRKPTFYADDNDTDGFSLRQGSLPCEASGGPGEPTPTPTPTLPSTGGPSPVAEELLTDANRGSIQAPATANAGQTISVLVGEQYAGDTVYVWLYSTPVSLGAHVVAQNGYITVTLPAGIDPGAHRLVILDAQGNVLGWTPIQIAGRLPATGSDATASVAGVVLALGLIAGGAALTVSRRRRAGRTHAAQH
ncbi:lamin tail domain-containing protein [Microbacterium sp. SLBN-146]|uniref:lamin tail domain-containing protein n=1 Tax=Microbacterium sp. SLBN-146 TaxID=2768457 RepID=UPI0011524508|nr:lamin tail domain-containing protein [Microbacterium sp. SLBN-146]TQJ30085.1 phytase-like protein with esterase activity [Microbacterium sp. SLBN-146]